MLVRRISPAPRSTASRTHSTAVRSVGVRPPFRNTWYSPPATRRASIASTTHCAPNTSASSPISSGRCTAAEFTDPLSAPASSTACASATERMPPPIVKGMKTSCAVRRARSTIVSRFSCEAVMSRKTSSSPPSASYRAASSTGSPASRMSTKFVPFTTRPLSTSRQGITLLSNTRAPVPQQLLRLADREAPLVQPLAGDHARRVHEPQLLQRAEVVERRDAAAVDEAAADRLRHRAHLVEVGAVQHAVAVGVRVDELADAARLHPADHVGGEHLRRLRPSGHAHVAAPHVDRHDHAHAPRLERGGEELDVGVRGGAEHHPSRPGR